MVDPYRWGNPPPAGVLHRRRVAEERRIALTNRRWLASQDPAAKSLAIAAKALGTSESSRTGPEELPGRQKSWPTS